MRNVRFSDPLVTRQVEYVPLDMGHERVEEGGVPGRGGTEINNGGGIQMVFIMVVSAGVVESNEQEG